MAHEVRPPHHAARMAELARALCTPRTSLLTLQRIVSETAELVPACDDVAVSVAHPDGTVETRASLGGLAGPADQLQAQYAEGPCVDTAWDSPLVRVDHLGAGRWPRWGPAAQDQLGLRSVLCAPLFTHEEHGLGVLQLFATAPSAFDGDLEDEVLEIAAHAAVALSAVADHEALQFGLVRRTTIGQATGLLMERYRLGSHEAFEVLRRTSQEDGRKVYDLAIELTTGLTTERQEPGEPPATVE